MRNLQGVLLFALFTSPIRGYISITALPTKRQQEWLSELTNDLCQTEIGHLTRDELNQGHQIMQAWSHSGKFCKDHAMAIERLISRMVIERKAGNEEALVTLEDYNCLLEGWAKSGAGEAAALRCEAILDGMKQSHLQPDLQTYKAVLMSWYNCPDGKGAEAGQKVLEEIVQTYQKGGNENILPDADCFDSVLQSYGKSYHENAPEAAEKLLFAMHRLYEAGGRCMPSSTSFNAVIAAWSRSQKPQAVSRIGKIFSFMENLGDPALRPDSYTYATIMGTLAKHRNRKEASTMAQHYLSHAISQYEKMKGGPKRFPLKAILFSTAIGCLSKSNLSGSFITAAAILQTQEAVYKGDRHNPARPDVFSYASVIDCCSRETDPTLQRDAFNLARRAYQSLEENATPNHVSYGIMLKAVAGLLPNNDLRRRWTRRVFEDACRDGCVGDMVITRVRQAATPALFKDLMQGQNKKRLPHEWTRNLPSNSRGQRQRAEV